MQIVELKNRIAEITEKIPGKVSLDLLIGEEKLSINPTDRISAASLIKVPIMLAAYLKSAREGLDLYQLIPIVESQRVGGMGVVTHLSPTLTLPLEDLVTLMIIVSDNTATNLCIDAIGIDYIGKIVSEFGCEQTVLGRRLMDYEARSRGLDNFTSARDMTILLREIWEGSKIPVAAQDKMKTTLMAQQFSSKIPRLIPYSKGTVVAHKTGEITAVEHDAAVIEVNGRCAYLTILLHELKDTHAGQDAMAHIGRLVWEYLSAL